MLSASAVAERVGPSVAVRCGECGDLFDLSVRRAFEYRRNGTAPRCRECRRPAMTDAERARLVQWWLESSGLSPAELHEIAVGLAAPE